MTLLQYHITMAIILSAKKLQSLLEKKHESLLVFSHDTSGVIRVAGMTEYLGGGKKNSRAR
jgi:hypothetical protein